MYKISGYHIVIAVIVHCVLITCNATPLHNKKESKSAPFNDNGSTSVNENLESLVDDAINGDVSITGDNLAMDPDDNEDMETAEAMVFRPLFSYRKQQLQKKKVYTDKNGHIQNPPSRPNQPSSLPKADTRNPPTYLAYDKKTGAYYPISSDYSAYHPGAYPGFGGRV